MDPKRILVVEDDKSIRKGIVDALEFTGYEVLQAANGNDGMTQALRATFDLLLLDLVLPGHSGFEILEAVRKARPTLAIVILTARGEEGDRVKGLRLGADDYVVKPFSVRELLARVEAVLRRTPERPKPVNRLAIPGGTADLARREIRYDDGARCEISERETELLGYLAANAGRAVAREEIFARVWRLDLQRIETRTIDMHIANLRQKLRDDQEEPKVILTVRGKGYMYAAKN
ncbi:MAG: response regulator transcription factor [Verrucomicrobia bacterium]|nr:response regulator transcription factor [Verrucomicrobiota bacterium]